jgi:diaphanous 1
VRRDIHQNLKDELALKGPQREAMFNLPMERKQYLLKQHHERTHSVSRATGSSRQHSLPAQASTFSPATSSGLIPRLVPQLTGDSGIMRRFSIVGWGTGSSPSHSPRASADLGGPSAKAEEKTRPESPTPIQSQSTGGLWSSWWSSSGGEKSTVAENVSQESLKTPKWYVDGIRLGKPPDMKLVKHLISLRVHLSTADLVWIESFVHESNGMDSLSKLLASLVGKGGKHKKLQNVEETVLLEAIKCIRVLLNTDVSIKPILTLRKRLSGFISLVSNSVSTNLN